MYMEQLPLDLQNYIYKLYMSNHVLPDVRRDAQSRTFCSNCALHGLPCLSCAYDVYEGMMGPGYCCGDRILFAMESCEEEYLDNEIAFISRRKPAFRVVCDMDDAKMHLPQNDCYYEMHTGYVE